MPTLNELRAERDKREAQKAELPAAGKGAGVAGAKETVRSIEKTMSPEKGKPAAEKAVTGANPNEKVVPKTTAAAPVKDASKPADKEFKK